LILLARFFFDRSHILYDYYNCEICKERKKLECNRVYAESIREIACICEGSDRECKICEGSGSFSLYKCPKIQMVEVKYLYRILPYFKRYRDSGCKEMPCGNFYKSTFLIRDAFRIMTAIDDQELQKTIPKE
jgi:hypothetical protein